LKRFDYIIHIVFLHFMWLKLRFYTRLLLALSNQYVNESAQVKEDAFVHKQI